MSFFQEYLDELVFEKIAERDTGDRVARGALGVGALGASAGLGYGALQAHRLHTNKSLAKAIAKETAKGSPNQKKIQKLMNRQGRVMDAYGNLKKGTKGTLDSAGMATKYVPNAATRKSTLLRDLRGDYSQSLDKAFSANRKGITDAKKLDKMYLRRANRTRLGMGAAALGSAGLGGYNIYKAIND